jgi:hypothetical protein
MVEVLEMTRACHWLEENDPESFEQLLAAFARQDGRAIEEIILGVPDRETGRKQDGENLDD